MCIQGKSFYWGHLINSELDDLRQWFDNRGKWLSQERIRQKSEGKVHWLQYMQIKNAVPKQWTDWMLQCKAPRFRKEHDNDYPTDIKINMAKNIFIEQKRTTPPAIRRWHIRQKTWYSKCMLIKKMTKETKLQVMQYRILHRIVPTKEKLFQQKLSDSPNCELCMGVKDTIEHMLFECRGSKQIWDILTNAVLTGMGHRIRPTIESCILGMNTNNDILKQWNSFALKIKWLLITYRTKQLNIRMTDIIRYIEIQIKLVENKERTFLQSILEQLR